MDLISTINQIFTLENVSIKKIKGQLQDHNYKILAPMLQVNEVILKCAGTYYENPNATEQKVSNVKSPSHCQKNKRYLGYPGETYNCASCHLYCIAQLESKNLNRKISYKPSLQSSTRKRKSKRKILL